MSKFDKLLEKLLNPSVVIKFTEVDYILKRFGYLEKKTGKTSGSRVAYINYELKHIIRIHKPHPGNELKRYAKNFIITELKAKGLI